MIPIGNMLGIWFGMAQEVTFILQEKVIRRQIP